MKRINGFLDIDDYFLTKESNDDIKEGNNGVDYWINIDGTEYYFKLTENPYIELICYEIAKFLGINAAFYDLAIFKGVKGVISKSYCRDGCNYVSGNQILKDYLRKKNNIQYLKQMGLKEKNVYLNIYLPRDINNLEVIWQAIEERYADLKIDIDINKIMNDIILLFIFNILTCQNDGMPQNWELEESENGVSLVPVFDNEFCLKLNDFGVASCKLTTNFNDNYQNNYLIIEEFLKISSIEYINLFLEKFNMLTIDVFLDLINIVEKRIGSVIPSDLKMEYMHVFNKNRKAIHKILDQLGYIRTKNI